MLTPKKGKMVESSSPCAKIAKEVCSETGMTRRSGGHEESEVGATDKGERHEQSSVAIMAMASFKRRRER